MWGMPGCEASGLFWDKTPVGIFSRRLTPPHPSTSPQRNSASDGRTTRYGPATSRHREDSIGVLMLIEEQVQEALRRER